MESIVAQLLELAVAWTGYVQPAQLPDVEVLPPAAMPCPCMGFFAYARRVPGYGTTIHLPSRLLLRTDVDVETPAGRSILLHELVHALQAGAGPAAFGSREWYRREREAYGVQARYLRMEDVYTLPGWPLSMRDE